MGSNSALIFHSYNQNCRRKDSLVSGTGTGLGICFFNSFLWQPHCFPSQSLIVCTIWVKLCLKVERWFWILLNKFWVPIASVGLAFSGKRSPTQYPEGGSVMITSVNSLTHIRHHRGKTASKMSPLFDDSMNHTSAYSDIQQQGEHECWNNAESSWWNVFKLRVTCVKSNLLERRINIY